MGEFLMRFFGFLVAPTSRFLNAWMRCACLLFLLTLSHTGVSAHEGHDMPPLQAIARLDVPRYMGRWYEVARFPNRFQKQCTGQTQAQYRLLPDARVEVLNRCRLADGGVQQALGLARPVDGVSTAQLQVRFAPDWLSWLPWVWGDYWVVDLDEDYTLAAVSEPSREYLWVLSRTPQVEPARYAALLKRLSAMGLDVGRLQKTEQ